MKRNTKLLLLPCGESVTIQHDNEGIFIGISVSGLLPKNTLLDILAKELS